MDICRKPDENSSSHGGRHKVNRPCRSSNSRITANIPAALDDIPEAHDPALDNDLSAKVYL